jgi:hypothetical protein
MKRALAIGLQILVLTALQTGTALPDAAPPERGHTRTVPATVLRFDVQEPGSDPYPARYTITDRFLRIDDADPGSGFILFDRGRHTVYSVSHDERTILELAPVAHGKAAPRSYRQTTVRREDAQAPLVGGRKPLHLQFRANGDTCYDVISVPGLLAPATAALQEYAVLSGHRQQVRLDTLPADIRTPCYLLRYAYGSGLPYQQGLPIREWAPDGYRRTLLDYRENVPVAASLFKLPADYDVLRLGGQAGTAAGP